MDPSEEYVTLNNGTKMPKFGLGTMRVTDEKACKKAFQEFGYKMFDCASIYKNEELIGKVINDLVNVDKTHKREDLFVISKVWFDEIEDVEAACKRSIAKLQVDYLDLYLVHWPFGLNAVPPTEEGGQTTWKRINMPMYKVWAQMEALVDKGLVKSIGISNFNVQLTWDMLSYCRIKPVVNEVELNPICV